MSTGSVPCSCSLSLSLLISDWVATVPACSCASYRVEIDVKFTPGSEIKADDSTIGKLQEAFAQLMARAWEIKVSKLTLAQAQASHPGVLSFLVMVMNGFPDQRTLYLDALNDGEGFEPTTESVFAVTAGPESQIVLALTSESPFFERMNQLEGSGANIKSLKPTKKGFSVVVEATKSSNSAASASSAAPTSVATPTVAPAPASSNAAGKPAAAKKDKESKHGPGHGEHKGTFFQESRPVVVAKEIVSLINTMRKQVLFAV